MNTNHDIALRLNPLPKKMEVEGDALIKPADLIISAPGNDVWSQRAARELSLFIRAGTGCAPKIINTFPDSRWAKPCIMLLSERDTALGADQFQAPFFDEFNLNPGFQAYRMKCLIGDNRMLVQGLATEGVYWGMKTLKQLMTVSKRSIRMPRVMIVDGADMEERGIWTNPFDMRSSPYRTRAQAEKHFCAWIDWMSDHKLNLVEVIAIGGAGLSFKSKKYPMFSSKDAATTQYLMRRVIQYGEEHGVRMIPIVTHTEHLGFISKQFPELKALNTTPHHGHSIRLPINYFNNKTGTILSDIVGEMVEAFRPRGICFWLAENRLHPLTGAGQKQSYFMRETRVFSEAAEHARKTVKPGLECRILLTQGSYPENSRLIHSLPRQVKWIFYSGERYGTYTVRPINPINADIAQAAREGYWISLCNPIRGVMARATVFDILHSNIGHAVRSGLKAVDGMSYAFPADKQSLFITAQDTWNYQGRSLDETFLAYACDLGVKDPGAHARAYRLADQANFEQAIRDTVGVGHPFGDNSRFCNMLERIKTNDKVDELIMIMVDAMEIDDIPALAQAVTDLETALQLIDTKADRIGYLRYHFLLCLVRMCLDITRAFYMNCREKCWDLYKGPWTDFRKEIQWCIEDINRQATQSTASFNELIKLEKWGGSDVKCENPLLKLAAFAKSIEPRSITSSRELKA